MRNHLSELSAALSIVCSIQRKYGTTAEQIDVLVRGFEWLLGGHDTDAVLAAIKKFAQRSSEIPTPAEILAIIEPPPPKPQWPAYIGIKQRIRDGHFVTAKQQGYVKWCEEWSVDQKISYDERQTAFAEVERLATKMLEPPVDKSPGASQD